MVAIGLGRLLPKIGGNNMNSFAVIRADDFDKVRVSLCDLMRYAHLTFADKPRRLEPAFADNILVHVMRNPLRTHCGAACIVPLNEDASTAIGRLRQIHPPSHVIIVSQRHEIFYELINYVDLLPEIEINTEWDTYGYASTREAELCKA